MKQHLKTKSKSEGGSSAQTASGKPPSDNDRKDIQDRGDDLLPEVAGRPRHITY